MAFSTIKGGFDLSKADAALINSNRAMTKEINDKFIQVGAVFLKASGKMPFDEEWFAKNYRDTNLQDWIDDEKLRQANVGFNLQFGWMDADIDADDPEFNKCLLAALDYNGIDTRFRFGRRSVGTATHVLIQLAEEEAASFDELAKFAPKEFRIGGKRYHVELRSYPNDKKNLARSAKQTVMPGSIYLAENEKDQYDPSIWYHGESPASNVREIAQTTPRRGNFHTIVRSIAFATLLYVVREHWTEGNRQFAATKVAGWLSRVVKDSGAMNNHEVISADVHCPVDSDDVAESLLTFICDYLGDDEKHMRIRAYNDAREKLERNPDAKIPGWPAMEALVGAAEVNALRTTFTPGSDVSILSRMAERYAYDETDNLYVDRVRHRDNHETFAHEPNSLERRHIDEVVVIGGKPRPAFKMYETSKMRVRIARRDMFPDQTPGAIFRVNKRGTLIGDEDPDDAAYPVFNTWRGWPIAAANPVKPELLNECEAYLDRLLGYLTSDNPDQINWVKDWIGWTFQHPAEKQQIAPVIVGGQGVGKSFFGNTFLGSLMGALWGSTSASIIDGKFNIGPFVNKMVVFVDEVKFHNESGTDEVKKLIRNVDVPGMLKYGEGQNFKIYARLVFASNTFDMAIGQKSVIDRALFYMRAYDAKFKGLTDSKFRAWTEELKPWFEEYALFLTRMDVREHYIHMFMTRPVNKNTIESIKFSSGNDPDIVGANMRPSRRFAKMILEEGRIFEDLSVDAPFPMHALGNRLLEMANMMNTKPPRTDLVVAEWTEAGLLERRGPVFFFLYKHETLIDRFGDAISTPLEKRYTFEEVDRGENDGSKRPWKGGKGRAF